MKKKDSSRQLNIPNAIVERCSYLNQSNISMPLIFFIDGNKDVGIAAVNPNIPFPNDFKFLCDCKYNKVGKVITIPEEVDFALGANENSQYYFAVSFLPGNYVYIYSANV